MIIYMNDLKILHKLELAFNLKHMKWFILIVIINVRKY